MDIFYYLKLFSLDDAFECFESPSVLPMKSPKEYSYFKLFPLVLLLLLGTFIEFNLFLNTLDMLLNDN